jgi:hypothetical protein
MAPEQTDVIPPAPDARRMLLSLPQAMMLLAPGRRFRWPIHRRNSFWARASVDCWVALCPMSWRWTMKG